MELTITKLEQTAVANGYQFKFITFKGKGTTLFRYPEDRVVVPCMEVVVHSSDGSLSWVHSFKTNFTDTHHFETPESAVEWAVANSN